jgi:hypothetical protein
MAGDKARAASPGKAGKPKAKTPARGPTEKDAPPAGLKAVIVSRETFALSERESASLESLKMAVAKEGHSVSRSELVRAGIQLLTGLAPPELVAAVHALPPVVKKKKKK